MGNPTDTTKKQKFLEAYKASKCNISKASEAINICRSTFYDWQEKDPDFAKQCHEIEESLTDKIEGVVRRNAEKGNQRAAEFWLTNHRKDKYANLQKTEISGEIQIIKKVYHNEDHE